ncbi:MAG TPA: preprotein translocase subunit SecG [Myxococcota bacterium]|nr:preprotein translocase subunit SecG [Myxococcota bacterium]
MIIFVTVLHVMVCLILIVVVLLQRGKGAEIGAVFGGGASSTVFGSRGAGNFLTKLTSGAAVVFMLTSLYLSYQGSKQFSKSILEDESKKPAAEETSKFAEPPKAPDSEAKQTPPAAPAEKPPAPANP